MRLLLRMKALICPYLANSQRAPVFQGACLPFLPPAGNKKIKMKQLWTIVVILLMVFTECFGQTAWYDPLQTRGSTYIQNQGWDEDEGNYHRFPNRVKDLVREKVWELSCQSAGLSFRFKTNAQDISIRYKVTQPLSMLHMPSTGVSGVDLYRYEDMAFCFGTYSLGDTIQYKYRVDRGVQVGKDTEYILYLPLYNEVSHLEIGVPEGSSFSFVPAVKECPIFLYGTSIAQGACASRPAMAWANIVGRKLELPLVNLGFSGNEKLEREIIELICEQYPELVILDCMPNMVAIGSHEIIRRMKDAVHRISKVPNVAILVVEHAGNSNALTLQAQGGQSARCNQAQQEAYLQLQKEGVKNLFYLFREELGLAPDAWVDYVHPSDYGMMQYASAIIKKIKSIIGMRE